MCSALEMKEKKGANWIHRWELVWAQDGYMRLYQLGVTAVHWGQFSSVYSMICTWVAMVFYPDCHSLYYKAMYFCCMFSEFSLFFFSYFIWFGSTYFTQQIEFPLYCVTVYSFAVSFLYGSFLNSAALFFFSILSVFPP